MLHQWNTVECICYLPHTYITSFQLSQVLRINFQMCNFITKMILNPVTFKYICSLVCICCGDLNQFIFWRLLSSQPPRWKPQILHRLYFAWRCSVVSLGGFHQIAVDGSTKRNHGANLRWTFSYLPSTAIKLRKWRYHIQIVGWLRRLTGPK